MLTLKVDGMSCDHCKTTITNAIHAVDAEAGVQIDLKHGLVNVRSHAASDSIKAAIKDSGFDVVQSNSSH
ncbi:MAG: heavy-metal-associated domain-containing protein [Oligoflexus sp.]|nr:heavy-metal-associated domain-containing protein [Oligoflexus sp.]